MRSKAHFLIYSELAESMKDEVKKSKQREKKEQIVAQVAEKVSKAKAIVFTNYQGMTNIQLENLKKGLKAVNAELMVVKNTLLKRALAQQDHELDENALKQPTATLFAYEDTLAPLKELMKSVKILKLPAVKFGIFSARGESTLGREATIYSSEQIMQLSTLPSREVLIAQFVGGLKSPLYGLHRALNWNIQKLVMTLKAIETKRKVVNN